MTGQQIHTQLDTRTTGTASGAALSVGDRLARGFDVAVIGGGAAGLSAAVALGRFRRSVVVLDAGAPRNAPAGGVHNFLTRDGMAPAELVEAGQREVDRYGGLMYHATATAARRTPGGFEVDLDDAQTVRARRLVVATGLVDELPAVPGLAERWGRDVLHCPYCHGWEVRDQAIGVLATGPAGVHQAQLFAQLSADVLLFQHTAAAVTAEQAEQLAARGIGVVTGLVEGVEVTGDRLSGLRLADGRVVARDAVVVATRLAARSPVLDSLGLQAVAHPMGIEVGEVYPTTDPGGATTVPGVWLAGNVTDAMAQVVSAAAQGLAAGAGVNLDLIAEDTRAAVHTARAPRADTAPGDLFTPASEARVADMVSGDRRHGLSLTDAGTSR